MAAGSTTFREHSILTRYIRQEYRGRKKNRPKPSAYQRAPKEQHLSVNSTDIHSVRQIAAIYADIFENGNRPVALTQPRVSDYNFAADHVGLTVTYNEPKGRWEFFEHNAVTPAYLHHARERNESHCGVEFVRALADFKEFQFATRMAKSKTYKMI